MSDERILDKLEVMDQRLDNIDVTLAKQSVMLDNHIYRTKLAEQNIEILKEDLTPILKKDHMIMGVFRFLGIVATIASFIYTLLKIGSIF